MVPDRLTPARGVTGQGLCFLWPRAVGITQFTAQRSQKFDDLLAAAKHPRRFLSFAKGKEKTFNRPAMGEFSIKRETTISRRLLDRIANAMRDAQHQRALEERFANPSHDHAT
ncbi:hypothetical protein ACCC98_05250 [Rhizobium pisi]|uniref:hypothetical protein n=1 Tax=Rhizobium pisi TaxID=574561 RepID=UPI0039AEB01F